MKAVVGLLMVLLGVSHAVETYCDGREEPARCYGALGGTVALQLINKTSAMHRYTWKKKASKNQTTQIILSVKNNNITRNIMSKRSVFVPDNGTFMINNLSRTDDGKYTLEIFDTNGKHTGIKTLQLSIQAPVSSVKLTSQCVSQGIVRVSCLNEEGDSPQYTWILDGKTTREAEILFNNTERNVIILKQNSSRYLTCSVRNNISQVYKEEMISVCEDDESHCNSREDGNSCYGALGGTVVIQLINVSETLKYEWKNKTSTILRGRGGIFTPNDIEGRFLFLPMYGTFSIMNLSKADGGEYTLETFNSDGRNIAKKTLRLIVQVPLSSVQLVPECLSQGEMKVSCLSEEGGSPQYNWTLDGHTLTDSELLSGNNQTNVIVLRQNISGRLVCSVWNRFSSLSKEKIISTCGFIFINCTVNGTQISEWVFAENNSLCIEPAKFTNEVLTAMASILSVLVFFLVVGIGFSCIQRKEHSYKVENSDREPVYAEVRVLPQQERQTEEIVEEEAEYKEETFSELSQQTEQATKTPVYAQVRKVR